MIRLLIAIAMFSGAEPVQSAPVRDDRDYAIIPSRPIIIIRPMEKFIVKSVPQDPIPEAIINNSDVTTPESCKKLGKGDKNA